ncbi:MAG TPA: adenylate kinase [Candidatus Dormibacteraeota bacterium]|jgi:adenylate kinase|nr:adenylate kinase [Candidatus Dormibacteraeota bacterium]
MMTILFGPPGSGKGTQAQYITKRYALPHVSTGEMLRDEVDRGTELGREVEPIMSEGRLVPDELIVRAIESRLRQPDAADGVLLDGFPRTVPQAQALDAMLRRMGREVDLVLCIDVPEDRLIERLLGRAAQEGRADDNLETIETRLEVFKRDTVPVLDHYRDQGRAVECVDGNAPIFDVAARIRDVMDRYYPNAA